MKSTTLHRLCSSSPRVISASDRIKSGRCWPELFDGTKPSTQCCGTLKAQQPCYCDFIKNPDLKKFATSREAHLALGFCGIPYPTC
ncbi:hypothetical protein BRARA_B03360 [Brassica rapa]|uniref:Bifunctional inhibitor/plant lipid transfer protein/seed storage helical domain-containing protein n=1 Tax=Brassica campestris TaxID=3711 RepID=A0A398AM99_BRACM|nr:hypothetical protein BRARA_B03360 [Brassica rapa]